MSTKIYNGYRFTNHNPLKNFKHILESVPALQRDTHKNVLRNLRKHLRGRMLEFQLEGFAAKEASQKALDAIATAIHTQILQNKNPTREYLFTDSLGQPSSLAYFPGNKKAGKKEHDLSTLYGGPDAEKEISTKLELLEYSYWDNSDEPEGMSQGEWDRRKKEWERLKTPVSSGWIIEVLTTRELYAACLQAMTSAAKDPEKGITAAMRKKQATRIAAATLQNREYSEMHLAIMAAGGSLPAFSFSKFNECRPEKKEVDEFLQKNQWLLKPSGVKNLSHQEILREEDIPSP